ncbi:MAG TPA: hypothetical protein VFA04_09165 [Bryobacteraceae bacterium]|nr:hypothetical protein [Bryobacteraceae bacterium]
MPSLARIGVPVFALAIIAIGVETIACAHYVAPRQGLQAIPVIPWLPEITALGWIFGVVWAACGVGLFLRRTQRVAALTLAFLLFLFALILDVPRNASKPADIGLRTLVFEPVAIAALACLLPGRTAIPKMLERTSRWLLALALVVFGIDHFLALQFIASLIPAWIPFRVFWVAFFGAAFIASGLSIGLDVLLRWGAAGIGLMFAIWVFTLHLPRVLGVYGIPGAPGNPNEWSSLFIAIALWGGPWALVRTTAEN